MILTILLILVIFTSIILFHELGHFMAARRAGIVVEEFGFGFPPRMFGIKRGGTIYSVNWLPLGGFVRMKGEDEVDTRPGTFNHASLAHKAQVLLAGVVMNFLMAYVILLLLTLTGLPKLYDGQFSLGKPTYAQAPALMTLAVSPNSPASRAGLKTGVLIVSADGQAFSKESELIDFTKAHAGQSVNFVFKQGGHLETKSIKLNPKSGDVGYLGVEPLAVSSQRFGWWSPVVAAGLLAQLAWKVLAGLGALVAGLVGALIHHSASSASAAGNSVAGPVGIVVILSSVMRLGWSYIMVFVLSICVSLGVVNALPLPALDGGRLFFTVLRSGLKWPSLEWEARINQAGFTALLVLLAAVTFLDIRRFL